MILVIQAGKEKGGFYRINKLNNRKVLEALDLKTNKYLQAKKIDLKIDKIDLLNLINRNDKYGKYAWSVISKIIIYSSSLVPQITDQYNDIDEALRLGFNWSMGPFEMLEKIGVQYFLSKINEEDKNEFLNKIKDQKVFMIKDKNIPTFKL